MPDNTPQPLDSSLPQTPTANTRLDRTLLNNQPLEPQSTGSSADDAMARSEQWSDGQSPNPLARTKQDGKAR